VTAFVDASVLVRHLTGEPAELAARATAYLYAADELLLSDLVVAELVHVLQSFYEAPRPAIAQAVRSLVAFDTIVCVDPALLLRTVEVFETAGVDFATAYQVACAETAGVGRIVSFDATIDRVPTVGRIEPP
jgi:predicted nucleic acid-binding protein